MSSNVPWPSRAARRSSSKTCRKPSAIPARPFPSSLPTPPSASTLAESKHVAERERIEEALERNGNNRLRAAAELGISRMTLYKKLRRLGLMAS